MIRDCLRPDHHYSKPCRVTFSWKFSKRVSLNPSTSGHTKTGSTYFECDRWSPRTPHHNGLFFFDIPFPSNYLNNPPKVYYHSHGLRLKYASGYVCLSLINTWGGNTKVKRNCSLFSIFQLLVCSMRERTSMSWDTPSQVSMSASLKRLDMGSAHALWIDWPGFVLFLQSIPLVMDVGAIFLGRRLSYVTGAGGIDQVYKLILVSLPAAVFVSPPVMNPGSAIDSLPMAIDCPVDQSLIHRQENSANDETADVRSSTASHTPSLLSGARSSESKERDKARAGTSLPVTRCCGDGRKWRGTGEAVGNRFWAYRLATLTSPEERRGCWRCPSVNSNAFYFFVKGF
ncbi:hypothetical protein RHSIM_Rhsim04G0030500 [Rhododendron simsii]|uniref:UBC core domain-containing protein n=1 Tax=Rhododendron simsii TaxID=118357 RepID=A0A834LRH8_RHOSS|nr:hypothetical protein RHSIM_Rhsim04G0030500 [Rhododendron simsii]